MLIPEHDLSQAVGTPASKRASRSERLIEREAELATLDRMLEGARAGYGRVAIIRGPAGIGKTRLLRELRGSAQGGDLTTLAARAGELERDFPFGCVRQLFESLIIGSRERREALLTGDARLSEAVFESPSDDPGPIPDPGYGTLHGLYWLTANLAERSPLLITLDDAHWADPASLRYLAFLARRLDGIPALVAITMRPAERGAETLLRELSQDPSTEVLDLAPLSERAVAEVLRAHLEGETTERVCALCHEATGGNPFLVRELLRALEGDAQARGELCEERIMALGPERVAEAVIDRLEGVGTGAPDLARAVAVLGDRAELRRAAPLADLDPDAAAGNADGLSDAGILEPGRPLRFVHPIVRNAVYQTMLPAERNGWHSRAASLLLDSDGAAEAVASHLLATEPGERDDAVDLLREAARTARSRGAPDGAVRYLQRALAEPMPPASRTILLSELGRDAASLGDPRAIEWLQEAVELDPGSPAAVSAAVALGRTLSFMGRADDALALGERVLANPGTVGEVGRRMERWLLSLAHSSPSTRRPAFDLVRGNLDAALSGESLTGGLLASAALESALCDGDAERTAELAERAADGVIEDSGADNLEPALAIAALVIAERFEHADQLLDRTLADARARGSLRYYAGTYSFRAWARYLQGRLTDVRADADLYPKLPQPAVTDLVLAGAQVQALVYAGELDRAVAVAAPIAAAPLDRELSLFQRFAEGLATLRLAQGDPQGALELADGMAAWEEGTGLRNGTWVAWRSQAAMAHAAMGERERALSLAGDQVALARRFGAPGMLGSALRVLGVIRGGEDGIGELREAGEALERSALRLEHARALIDLGAAQRRDGQQASSRERLREGLDLAHRCGAAALANVALDELVAAGGRPRQRVASDADTLTPSERRVSEMAAAGMTNKEIAQALFVTVKTVETHLGHAYGKLGINSRSQLAGRLASDEERVAG